MEVRASAKGTLWKRGVVSCARWTNSVYHNISSRPLEKNHRRSPPTPHPPVCPSLTLCRYSLYQCSVCPEYKVLFPFFTYPCLSSLAPQGFCLRAAPFLAGPLKSALTGLLLSVSLCSTPSAILLSFRQCSRLPSHKSQTSWEDPPWPSAFLPTFSQCDVHSSVAFPLPFIPPKGLAPSPTLSSEFLVSLQNEGQAFTFLFLRDEASSFRI